MKHVIILFIMLICTIGPSIVIAMVGCAAVQGLSRNPAASPKILITMLLSFLFAEAIAIISLLTVFNLLK